MILSQRQKILSGVFAVGLVGLMADRMLLRPPGGPKAASAESSAPAANAAVPAGSTPVDQNAPARAPLAERLSKLLPDQQSGSVERRDPFSLPASWSGGGAANGTKIQDASQVFARQHQLKAIVVQGEDVSAQVDDSVLMPGQTIDGFRLVSVDARSATFEGEGKQVTLELVIQ